MSGSLNLRVESGSRILLAPVRLLPNGNDKLSDGVGSPSKDNGSGKAGVVFNLLAEREDSKAGAETQRKGQFLPSGGGNSLRGRRRASTSNPSPFDLEGAPAPQVQLERIDRCLQERSIRVFISSTFLDMQADRDALNKYAFPRLQQLCAKKGFAFVAIDLRWGITDSEAKDGKVLSLCFTEIDRCRPYFLALLGSRYGWHQDPGEPTDDLLAANIHHASTSYPIVKQYANRSLTEMEIRYGALEPLAPYVLQKVHMLGQNRPKGTTKFFYLRDAQHDPVVKQLMGQHQQVQMQQSMQSRIWSQANYSNYNSVGLGSRPNVTEESEYAKERMAALKAEILDSEYVFHDDYKGPQDLSDLVLADLSAAIERDFPDIQMTLGQRARAVHDAIAMGYRRFWVPRKDVAQQLSEKALQCRGGPNPTGVLCCLVGERGCGKSAVLANWVHEWQQGNPEDLVLPYFLGGVDRTMSPLDLLRCLMDEIEERFDVIDNVNDWDKAADDELIQMFPRLLQMVAQQNPSQRLIVVLDAVDALLLPSSSPVVPCNPRLHDLKWLPSSLPPGVCVLVSITTGTAAPSLHTVDVVCRRGWDVLLCASLRADQLVSMIKVHLAEYGKRLSNTQAERLIWRLHNRDALWVRVFADEIRMHGDYNTLDTKIDEYLNAHDLGALFDKVLCRWERDYGAAVGSMCRVIRVSCKGIGEDDLCGLLRLDAKQWCIIREAMAASIAIRDGFVRFVYPELAHAVDRRYLNRNDRKAVNSPYSLIYWHRRISSYLQTLPSLPRRQEELKWHLKKLEEFWTDPWTGVADGLGQP